MGSRTATRRIAAGLSTDAGTADAAAEAARAAARELPPGGVDLAFLFVSHEHLEDAAAAAHVVREELEPGHLVGCAAQGVLAGAREVEEGPAVAVWAASLPGAEIEGFHLAAEDGDGLVSGGFPYAGAADLVALLADPFTFPVGEFLAELNHEYGTLPLVGGLATGGGPGSQALVLDDEVYDHGAVGVALTGVRVATVVSQGCAPIGREAVVTAAEGNVVHELAGQPAVEWVRAQIASLSPERQLAAARGILAGLVIDENKADYGRGDYLMRALIGVDEKRGSLAIGETARVGQTFRLHVRDAATADEDLRENLASAVEGVRPAGALLFTCNGRGTNMFPQADHDAALVAEALGAPAVAGFFCGGELGPVGGRAFLHGFTATLAVFLDD